MFVVSIIILLIAVAIGFEIRKIEHQRQLKIAHEQAQQTLAKAEAEGKAAAQKEHKKGRAETLAYQESIDQEITTDVKDNERKATWLDQRDQVLKEKEDLLNRRSDNFKSKQDALKDDKSALKEIKQQAEGLIGKREETLEETAEMSKAKAKDYVLDQTSRDLKEEEKRVVRNTETEYKSSSEKEAKNLISHAIEHSGIRSHVYSSNRTMEVPNNEALGKIIGNSGQNVRALEALTGIDINIDDQKRMITLNGYDPMRREIAKRAMTQIVQVNRINPDIVEQIVNQTVKSVDELIRGFGEQAINELNIKNMHPDLIKLIGRMHFRTSYGQNILDHSIEAANLAGVFAAELGEDVNLAKRAGLLHDIGKAIDRDVEATHVELGVELATKYHEDPVVINAIASHHGDVEAKYVISDLVAAADAISGARQGARSESAADYLQRISSLEGIANQYPGVQESYAIQAGRELRVIVKPNQTSDKSIEKLAGNVKDQIEQEVTYPGQVKVTVVRKLQVVEYAG
ncbi:Hydrolase (HAD superfamily) [Pediococcus damnosus]|uniref:Ribonuclease Y n=1 Tax=Pediococcus damnosus TaxID=51663 RepID=A0A0R2HLX3_9LACO|nr:ribonuclease Y [Pediococcus damnosus]AMV61096.1 Hydrolase (HAD superfamily) [Pediococcus damnosus]AMV63654.1 Hydrolase (HAD superfamily) [Pediococcus damnosus]AMV65455.1 Hydrolase (HAD superfamily) [Pediococcus damnosus]AMV66405.1 Hydrolase (HAD superfamily) [Pediococcus damnosus]AMV68704.1 Hydrolase (HAD superfamily) [Pediococcus damnosus]